MTNIYIVYVDTRYYDMGEITNIVAFSNEDDANGFLYRLETAYETYKEKYKKNRPKFKSMNNVTFENRFKVINHNIEATKKDELLKKKLNEESGFPEYDFSYWDQDYTIFGIEELEIR